MLQHLLETGLRQTMNCLVKPALHPTVPIAVQRTLTRQAYRSSVAPRGCRFQADTLAGIPVIRSSFGQATRGAVLYLHGGGYIIGSAATHKGLAGHLAKACGCMVVTPDYRLAPEHPFPAALDDAEAAWRALIEEGFAPGHIAIAGDSAGGGLAIALAMRLRDMQHPLPASLTVFSPWVDLTQETLYSPECEPVLQARWTANAAKLYAGEESLRNPLLSPVFGNLEGLPPLLIQVGSQEILLNDAERLARAASTAGVNTQLEVFNSLWHVFQVHSSQLDRAAAAVHTAGAHIRGHLAD
ncbi:MAG TPA: alpha/beta hydrolase [Marinobacter sp.]|uniref:Alpha/beta hydrolase n=2 Tax=root TaxID=1 RepID=A0A831VZN2_9GAMM|nr:alpha/beta hydrolase [Marinobacter antarcticus]HDZ39423.1 alpha/beta hydrolase [Marinobacter sp.]HEA53956.1 alpha/beta hydrolase [Marinobacter antarcticus]